MYSVLRFTIDKARAAELLALGDEMNEVEPGVFAGPRRAGDGFSCDLSRSDRWADHADELVDFLNVHADAVRKAVALGATVAADIAIDPEDQARVSHALVLGAPASFLAPLAALGVGLEITLYRPVAS